MRTRRPRYQPSRRGASCWRPITFFAVATVIALAMFGAGSLTAAAAEVRSGDSPSVPQGQTVNEDLYVFGGDVEIAGNVTGDVVVASGRLSFPGQIRGSLSVAAGEITIDGSVDRSARIAGGQVTVTGEIGGDLVVTSGEVTITSTGGVGGDLLVAGGDVIVDGAVDGDIRGQIGTLTINGVVGEDVRVNVDELDLQGDAEIGGDLDYASPRTADIADGASVTGTQTYSESTRFSPGDNLTSWLFGPLFRLLCALFAGLVFILLLPRAALTVADGIRIAPASSFVLGLVLLFVVPFVTVILLITVIGIPVALILLVSYACLLYLSQIIVGLALGRIVLPKSWDTYGRGYNLLAMTLGVIVLAGLRFIPLPFLGTVVAILTAIFALGAVVLGPRRRSQPVMVSR